MTFIHTYATSTNLGPLFDRMGLKLGEPFFTSTYGNTRRYRGLVIKSKYLVPSANSAQDLFSKMVKDFDINGGLELYVKNNLPDCLGKSAAHAVAVVELTNSLYNLGLTEKQKISYAILGEPGQKSCNVVPCVVGGLVHSYKTGKDLDYKKLEIPSFFRVGVVIPKNLSGTTEAEDVAKGLDYNTAEAGHASCLGERFFVALLRENFDILRTAILDYTEWGKSITNVRNAEGVYGIDVRMLNQKLEQFLGSSAVITPSGGGPAMLLFAENDDARDRGLKRVEAAYTMKGEPVETFGININPKSSYEELGLLTQVY